MDSARYKAIREEYQRERYLRQADHDELTKRLDDVFGNLICFTHEGQVVVRAPLESNPFLALFIHVLEELHLRGERQYSFPVQNFHLDNAKYPNVSRASRVWAEKKMKPASYILKFGESQYLEALLDRGAMRVCPASCYREPSFAPAIRDEELEFTHDFFDGDIRIRDNQGEWRSWDAVGPFQITHKAQSNYYVSCYAVVFENRLFDDFKADACLIIKNPDQFCSRIATALAEALPDWVCMIGGVKYLDPLRPSRETDPDIYFSKHFRFSYQTEFRLVWVPREPKLDLSPVHLEMGDLSSFCELVKV